MAQEVRVKGYYDSILSDTNYVNTSVANAVGVEFFLSELLFKRDLSRVVYAKEDIAFRRRVETVGKGRVDAGKYDVTGLDLPFAAYSQSGNLEPDDRSYAMNSGQIVLGQMQPDTGINVKAAAVMVKYSATAFFARRDDVSIASQLLYWDTQPKFPLYVIIQHRIAGWPLDIPVFITIDSFDSDVAYQEKKWLTDSKIFPVKIEMTIRTYQTLIEHDGGYKLPLRFSGLYAYNDQDIYFTHDTILNWADQKWTPPPPASLWRPRASEIALIETEKLGGTRPSVTIDLANASHEPLIVKANKYTYETVFNTYQLELERLTLQPGEVVALKTVHGDKIGYDRELKAGIIPPPAFTPEFPYGIVASVREPEEIGGETRHYFDRGDEGPLDYEQVNGAVAMAVAGYFDPSLDLTLSNYYVKEIGDDFLTVAWSVTDSEVQNFDNLMLYMPGIVNHLVKHVGLREYRVEGLHPASDYEMTLILQSKKGGSHTYTLKARTTGDPVIGDAVDLRSNLIGRTFTNRPM